MSRSQRRDAQGRFANGFYRAVDDYLRSGSHVHGRTIIDEPEPLADLATDSGASGDRYYYLVAVRAVVRWRADGRPERAVEAEFVDTTRDRLVVRAIPGRVGCENGRVRVRRADLDAVPRRLATAEGAGIPLDGAVEESTREGYGDALRAHEELEAGQ